ncbi:MAG: hypothetical protein ACE5R4_15735, partial [Armatimonadota bacterium]
LPEHSGTRGIPRSQLPWYMGTGFSAASGAIGLGVCAGAWYFASQGPGEMSVRLCVQLTMLGAVLGLISGHLRSLALASLMPIDGATQRGGDGSEAGAEVRAATEEACLLAMSGTAAGRGSLAMEALGLAAAIALGIAARSWTPPALVYGALTAAEQVTYLFWLRRQPQ